MDVYFLLSNFQWEYIHFIIDKLWHIIVPVIYYYHVNDNYNYIYNVIGTLWPFTMRNITGFKPTHVDDMTLENNLIGLRYHFAYIYEIYMYYPK